MPTIRAYTDFDARAVIEIHDAAGAVEPTFKAPSVEAWRAFTELSFNRDARDFLIATEGDETIALATSTLLEGTPALRHFRIVVHPEHRRRGLGRALLDRIRSQPSLPGTELQSNCNVSWHTGRAFLGAMGFRETERQLPMTLTRDELPRIAMPDGVALREGRPGNDDATWIGLHQHGFADAPGYAPLRPADLAAKRALDGFCLWLAVSGNDVVGMCQSEHLAAGTGIIENLVVHRSARRRGLGRALLDAGVRTLRAAGCQRIDLVVDAANHGAVALYEGYGFEAYDAVCTMRRPLDR